MKIDIQLRKKKKKSYIHIDENEACASLYTIDWTTKKMLERALCHKLDRPSPFGWFVIVKSMMVIQNLQLICC